MHVLVRHHFKAHAFGYVSNVSSASPRCLDLQNNNNHIGFHKKCYKGTLHYHGGTTTKNSGPFECTYVMLCRACNAIQCNATQDNVYILCIYIERERESHKHVLYMCIIKGHVSWLLFAWSKLNLTHDNRPFGQTCSSSFGVQSSAQLSTGLQLLNRIQVVLMTKSPSCL